MTVTLNLKPETEAGLLMQAEASGMVLEDYLLTLVEGAAHSTTGGMNAEEREHRTEAVRKMLAFGDQHRLDLAEPVTRAVLHESHRF